MNFLYSSLEKSRDRQKKCFGHRHSMSEATSFKPRAKTHREELHSEASSTHTENATRAMFQGSSACLLSRWRPTAKHTNLPLCEVVRLIGSGKLAY